MELKNELLLWIVLKMRTFNLDDLHIFRSVVEEGGVIKAAALLNRVPSNITTRIKKLEERLDVQLFQRQGRGIVLTEAGQILHQHSERILHMADDIERDICGLGARGNLKIGSLESAAGVRLPKILAQFNAEYSEISLELKTGSTDFLLERLKTFDIEAAFVSEPCDLGSLNSIKVFEEELVLISSTQVKAITEPQDLKGVTIVAFVHGCSYRRCLIEWLAEAKVSPKRFLDLSSYHAIVACVAAGAGIAIMPRSILEHVVIGDVVKQHTLPNHIKKNNTYLVWNGNTSPQLRALISLIPNTN